MKKEYNKLVRDKIPEIIRNSGATSYTHIADDAEYEESLVKKLHEEVEEFLEDSSVGEAADIMEVLYAWSVLKGFDFDSIESKRIDKRNKRGGFEKRIILESTEE